MVGTCELMCPAAERAERERDGNIRVFERVDPNNPNLSSEDLAVKIFVRTAVRAFALRESRPCMRLATDDVVSRAAASASARWCSASHGHGTY